MKSRGNIESREFQIYLLFLGGYFVPFISDIAEVELWALFSHTNNRKKSCYVKEFEILEL